MSEHIIKICIIISLLSMNANLWIRLWEKTGGSRKVDYALSTGVIIIFAFDMWQFTDQSLPFLLLLFTLSYANLCIVFRKNCKKIPYTFIFSVLTVFFVVWITVLFGKYYYDNHFIDVEIYTARITEIYNSYKWFPVYDFHLSIIFFEIAVEKYFVMPEKFLLNDVHFIQFISGIIISGTIISGIFDFMKKKIFPGNKNLIE